MIYKEGRLTDFTVVAGGREMPAHQVVLSARSPVFAAMLEPHTEEFKNKRVNFPDIDYEVGATTAAVALSLVRLRILSDCACGCVCVCMWTFVSLCMELVHVCVYCILASVISGCTHSRRSGQEKNRNWLFTVYMSTHANKKKR